MNRLIVILLVAFCLLSCKQEFDIEKYDIARIEVYHISFELLFPTQMVEESVRETKSYQIDNSSKIDNIVEQIKSSSRVKSGAGFNKNQVYLVCDFYTKKDKAFTLMFDKNFIDLNGKTYENNELLINTLIKKD
ncbi:hypothetical protein [Aquimarina algiphila]|uniref:hypothetical protein n=1 Tax=Aquimarina algiphila TaxID=2047982 RepID=UPI00232BD685|nr:hypothetical protein [Aquimarina algiphila]